MRIQWERRTDGQTVDGARVGGAKERMLEGLEWTIRRRGAG